MVQNESQRQRSEEERKVLKATRSSSGPAHPFSTIKEWIHKRKIRSVKTAGGHHRIPRSEVDRLLFRTMGKTAPERALIQRRVSGRNQLVGRIESVRISGLLAEGTISLGNQDITSMITSTSARETHLEPGQTVAALIKATEIMIVRV